MLIGPMPNVGFQTAVAPTEVSPKPGSNSGNPFKTPEDFGADTGLFGNIGSFFTGENTSASNQAEAYNKWLETQYNAQQNEAARNWDLFMSSTQYQRKVEDLKKAGINPYYALGSGGASMPGAYPTAVSKPDNLKSSNPDRNTGAFLSAIALLLAAALKKPKVK